MWVQLVSSILELFFKSISNFMQISQDLILASENFECNVAIMWTEGINIY